MLRRRNKYKAIRTVVDNHIFPSGREANRYIQLKLLERSREISGLILQPKFWLTIDGKPILLRSEGYPNGRRASFKPDFQYVRKDGATVVEDAKSPATRTEAYVLRKGIFELLYPDIIFLEV